MTLRGKRYSTWLVGLAVVGVLVSGVAAVPASGVGAGRVRPRAEAVTVAATAAVVSRQAVGTGQARATITRDRYGVPTITAGTMRGLWFGVGWAQAEDRMVQLELTRRAVEGELSAIAGPSELSQDETVRTLGYTQAELLDQYDDLPAAMRADLVAYTDGVNGYESLAYRDKANEKADVPYEFTILALLLGGPAPYRPAPWRPQDTVAVGDYLARDFGGGGGSELQNLSFLRYLEAELTAKGDADADADAMAIFNDSRWINDLTAPTTVPNHQGLVALRQADSAIASPSAVATAKTLASLDFVSNSALAKAAAAWARDRTNILQTGVTWKVLAHGGSDAFVVAPSRSKDHKALLWGAPQEGFGTPSIDYEEYLHGPNYDAGGMAIAAEPFILIGRNNKIAWTTTSEEVVDQRIYAEQADFSTSPPTYLYDGKWIPMQVINEVIPVHGQKPVHFPVYRTVDGPVISYDAAGGSAFSMRFASWMKETGSLLGFSQLGGDQNLAQFRHSMSLVTTLHNFMYADQSGNIAYFGDGLVPVEPSPAVVDPRLPALGDGTEQWHGFVPFSQMPHSVNPPQGYLDNWNTKPSEAMYYQQNGGDEYWGTIFRSTRIAQMLSASKSIDIGYLESVEKSIGTIDNGDNTRPAAPFFIPFVVKAYRALVKAGDPIVDPTTHPDLAPAISALQKWNDEDTLGSPAMSIFMNFLEALERNVFEGGLNSGEQYVGAVDFDDSSLGMGTYGGLGGYATYNFLYHILDDTAGVLPCWTICYTGDYFAGHRDQILVESLNDAIAILSGTGQQLGQGVPGFGTPDIHKWGFEPAQDINWDDLDPLAIGVTVNCGTSPSQNRSTYMQAIELNSAVIGQNVLPPGESGFINSSGVASSHLCDQVGLFNAFKYKAMPPANP